MVGMAEDLFDSGASSYVQASFRLTPDTHEAIKQLARFHGVSQSDIMRSATELFRHSESLSENVRLATVDVSDTADGKRFRVVDWLITK